MHKTHAIRRISVSNYREISKKLREFAQEWFKKNYPSQTGRANLAEKAGYSESAIHQAIHRGEGGLEFWVAIFAAHYDWDFDQALKFFIEFNHASKIDRSDQLFYELKYDPVLKPSEEDLQLILMTGCEALKIRQQIKKESSKSKK